MMMGIFSSFDDHNRVLFNFYHLMWLMSLVAVMVMNRMYFMSASANRALYFGFLSVAEDLINRTQAKGLGGSSSIITCMLLALVMLNLGGLLPYIFSLTSHLAINLALSAPVWLSIILSSMFFNLPSFLAHLQPTGAPAMLNPFLCVIELVSLVVRPITLAVRLTANLSTGHILMGLLGTSFMSSSMMTASLVLVIGSFYYMFELCVCLIQGYIFTLLPTLYLDEHPSNTIWH